MATLAQAVVAGLAGWRIARLLVAEDGPWDMFFRLRRRAGVGQPGEVGFFDGVLSCMACCTVWSTAACYAALKWGVTALVVTALAAAAVALTLEESLVRGHPD